MHDCVMAETQPPCHLGCLEHLFFDIRDEHCERRVHHRWCCICSDATLDLVTSKDEDVLWSDVTCESARHCRAASTSTLEVTPFPKDKDAPRKTRLSARMAGTSGHLRGSERRSLRRARGMDSALSSGGGITTGSCLQAPTHGAQATAPAPSGCLPRAHVAADFISALGLPIGPWH